MTVPLGASAAGTGGEAELERLRRENARLQSELSRLRAVSTSSSVPDRYRAIFDSAADFAILATDINGLVTDWNPGAERILGWRETEMLGEPANRIFTPEDCSAAQPAAEMRRAMETGRAADERWHLRRDGSRFWASGEMMVLRDRDGAHLGFLKILRDRTMQQKAAEEQRSDAEFLRGVLAASGDCIKVLDPDGRLLFMSEGGQRVMEVCDFNLIQGCPWPDFWEGEGSAQAKSAVEAARDGGSGRFQGFARTMAGTPKWWDVQVTPIPGPDGRPERLLSVSRDITAIRQAEIALQMSEQLQRRFVETLPQLVWSCRPDGACDYLSPQ